MWYSCVCVCVCVEGEIKRERERVMDTKADDGDDYVEELLFRCEECYVYQIPRTASSHGHRADDWDVDNWLQAVELKVTARGAAATIKLIDKDTKDLFAAVPVPQDQPLVTCVEPVIDSSRYYVVKVVDEASGRHAFLGLGFRHREESSNFTAALDEHVQYLRRMKQAEEMRKSYEKEAEARAGDAASVPGGEDRALKEGQTITISIGRRSATGSPGGDATKPKKQTPPLSLGAMTITPPPPPSGRREARPAAAAAPPPETAQENDDDDDDFGDFQS